MILYVTYSNCFMCILGHFDSNLNTNIYPLNLIKYKLNEIIKLTF